MRCYYHQEKDAVGTCKSCGKGLCPECAVDLTKGLACRGRCEEDTLTLIRLIDHNVKNQPVASRLIHAGRSVRMAGSLFYLAIGAVFLFFGLANERQMSLVTILGACFMAYGLYYIVLARKIARQAQADK